MTEIIRKEPATKTAICIQGPRSQNRSKNAARAAVAKAAKDADIQKWDARGKVLATELSWLQRKEKALIKFAKEYVRTRLKTESHRL